MTIPTCPVCGAELVAVVLPDGGVSPPVCQACDRQIPDVEIIWIQAEPQAQ